MILLFNDFIYTCTRITPLIKITKASHWSALSSLRRSKTEKKAVVKIFS